MKLKLLLLVACLYVTSLLTGCTTMHFGNKAISEQTTISELENHKNTKEDVYIAYGQPNDVVYELEQSNSEKNTGKSAWFYYDMSSSVSGPTYIPIVGLFAGGSNFEGTSLKVYFDENDHVDRITRRNIDKTVNMWSLTGATDGDNPRDRVRKEMLKIGMDVDETQLSTFTGMEKILYGKDASYK